MPTTSPKRRATKRRRPIAPRAISPAKWAAMTAPQRAVAIAKDVLYRIAIGQLEATPGTWVAVPSSPTKDLQEAILQQQHCHACALGAAICGVARFEDRIQLDDQRRVGLWAANVSDRLIEVFGDNEARAMEVAFEGSQSSGFGDCLHSVADRPAEDLYQRALAFAAKHGPDRSRHAKRRLKAIYANIVKHKGIFTP